MPTYPCLTQVVHSAARAADQVCLMQGERQTTNAQFRDRVARLAGGLLGAGAEPGDRVAIGPRAGHRGHADLGRAVPAGRGR